MANINIKYDMVKSIANDMNTLNSKISQVMEDINSECNKLNSDSSPWVGEGATYFYKNFSNCIYYREKLIEDMQKTVSKINNAIGTLIDADNRMKKLLEDQFSIAK